MRALASLAFILYAVNSAILVWLHLPGRGVDPITQAVSDYGVGERGWIFKIHGVVGCLAALALACAVVTVERPAFPGSIVAYLLVMAAARLVVGFIPTDGIGGALTTTGRVHAAAAAVVFACAGLVIVNATRAMATTWPAYAGHWIAFKWLVVVALAGVAATRFKLWRRAFGIFERAFILLSTAWFMALTAVLAIGT